jgi:hypothetical protein
MTYLKAIFAYAVEEDVLPKSPARRLSLPDGLGDPVRGFLSLDDFKGLKEELPSRRDQIMAGLLFLGGLRRGELFGLKWKDFTGDSIAVVRQMNRFQAEVVPKTKCSVGIIPLPSELCVDLLWWSLVARIHRRMRSSSPARKEQRSTTRTGLTGRCSLPPKERNLAGLGITCSDGATPPKLTKPGSRTRASKHSCGMPHLKSHATSTCKRFLNRRRKL